MLSELCQFSKSPSRNHIAFVTGDAEGVCFVDLGYELSTKIEDILNDRRLPMKAQDCLKDIILSNIHQDSEIGEYIAIKNIGILFEPELNLSVEALFNFWSQNTQLIIKMENAEVKNNRYYLAKGCSIQYSVELNNFNNIII